MGGFIFKCVCVCVCVCGGGEGCPWGGISFGGRGGFEKNRKMRGAPYGPTMGNPEKNHLTIKNNCSILKKQ